MTGRGRDNMGRGGGGKMAVRLPPDQIELPPRRRPHRDGRKKTRGGKPRVQCRTENGAQAPPPAAMLSGLNELRSFAFRYSRFIRPMKSWEISFGQAALHS